MNINNNLHYHLLLVFKNAGDVEFVGPNSSGLIFTSGQSIGDIQCTNVAVLDDDVFEGERNFTISLRNNTSFVNDSNMPSVDFSIAPDIEDGMYN